jgi:hypothetical protein
MADKMANNTKGETLPLSNIDAASKLSGGAENVRVGPFVPRLSINEEPILATKSRENLRGQIERVNVTKGTVSSQQDQLEQPSEFFSEAPRRQVQTEPTPVASRTFLPSDGLAIDSLEVDGLRDVNDTLRRAMNQKKFQTLGRGDASRLDQNVKNVSGNLAVHLAQPPNLLPLNATQVRPLYFIYYEKRQKKKK